MSSATVKNGGMTSPVVTRVAATIRWRCATVPCMQCNVVNFYAFKQLINKRLKHQENWDCGTIEETSLYTKREYYKQMKVMYKTHKPKQRLPTEWPKKASHHQNA